MKRMRLVGNIFGTLLLLLSAACSGESTATRPGPGQALIDLPVPSAALFSSMEAHTYRGSWAVADNGLATVEFLPGQDIRMAIITSKDNDKPLLYSYNFPDSIQSNILSEFVDHGNGVRVSARSTALAMIMVNPLLIGARVDDRALIAAEAVANPNFDKLARTIEDYKITDPMLVISYETTPDLFYQAGKLLVASMRTVADRLPDRQPTGYAPKGISIDKNMAYPETLNQQGQSILRLVNPTMIYYVVGFRAKGVVDANPNDWTTGSGATSTLVPGKERWLDISIFPPKFEVVPPVQVDMAAGYDAVQLNFYKGFQFDMSINEIWNTPPAKLALIANLWQSFNMMIALAGDISAFFLPTNFFNYLSDEIWTNASFANLMTSVQARDRNATISSVYDVFRAVLPAVQDYITANYASDAGTLTQVSSVFSGVWNLISGGSIVNSIIDITTRDIPFFWDMFTAHSSATYPMFGGKIQAFPNSPMISAVVPAVPMNGRPVYIRGYGMADPSGNGTVTVDGVDLDASAITMWNDGTIVVRMPADEEGHLVNNVRKINLRIVKADGTKTNVYTTNYAYNSHAAAAAAAEEGGGCSAVSTQGASAMVALEMLLALAAIVAWKRRNTLQEAA